MIRHRKGWQSVSVAMASKAWNNRPPGAVLDTGCPCGLVHIRKPRPVRGQRRTPRNTGLSRTVRRLVLERDHYRCVACGRPIEGAAYSIQHRKARGMGGTADPAINSPANLIVLCGTATTGCHARAEARDIDGRRNGYWVRQQEHPADIPVLIASATPGSGTRLFLTESGTYSTRHPGEESAA